MSVKRIVASLSPSGSMETPEGCGMKKGKPHEDQEIVTLIGKRKKGFFR